MPRIKNLFLIYFCCFLISACSGGGSNNDTAIPAPPSSSILGTLKTAANVDVDSDTNDSETPSTDNSSFANAQAIQNFVTLQGFVSKVETSTIKKDEDQRAFDRFYLKPDPNDYFQVQLQAGQLIQLEVVNQTKTNNQTPSTDDDVFNGDLDLSLHSSTYAIIGSSATFNKYETLQVPRDDTYYIRVNANSGASKYILQIRPADDGASSSSTFNTSMDFIPNEFIIQFKNNFSTVYKSGSEDLKTIHEGINRPTLAILEDTQMQVANQHNTTPPELATLNYEAYEKVKTLQKLKTLQQQANIQSVSLNYIRTIQKTPSDKYFPYQWHYPLMNLPQAWDLTTGYPAIGSVIVAVVDTGIYSDHQDLKNKLVSGYDFISSNQNSGDDEPGIDNNPEDTGDGIEPGTSSWHGSHVAGTIAAQSDNSIGVAGVSWGAKIMPLRALGRNGGSSYDIMQAIRFAAGLENDSGTLPAKPADIINLSFGGAGSSLSEADLFKELHNKGIIVVAAAGNDNSSNPFFPASYDNVVSVSAIDFNKTKAPYSNFGSKIDIAAPGGDLSKNRNQDAFDDGVLSTSLDDTNGFKQEQYSFYEGTSMAAPHVAGMFALMKAAYPELTAAIADNLLMSGSLSDEAGNLGRDNIYGYGTANAFKAVKIASSLANGGSPPNTQAVILAQPTSLNFANSTRANLVISNEGGGNPQIQSISSNSNWLDISSINTNSEGFGSYQVDVDPTNLSSGFYFGSINFTFNETVLTVRVSLSVGNSSEDGKVAQVYALLFNMENDEFVQDAKANSSDSGDLEFTFSQVPQGTYYIVSGTDIDNNGYICELGEACAVYPPSSQISPIDNSALETINIEVTANIINSLSSFSELGSQGIAGRGFKRELLTVPTNIQIKQFER